MTPNDIEILIHYYSSPSIHPRIDAPAVTESIQEFVKNGILERGGDFGFRVTNKGRALMKLLCSTSFPIAAWVDENGKAIEFSPINYPE